MQCSDGVADRLTEIYCYLGGTDRLASGASYRGRKNLVEYYIYIYILIGFHQLLCTIIDIDTNSDF